MSNMVHTSAGEKSTITPNSMQTAKPVQSAFDLGLESVAFPTPAVSEHLPGHSLSKFSVHYGSALPVQTKLTVGPVNDHYEQEADHVAQRVVEQINNPIAQRQEMPEDEKDKPQTKAFNGAIQRQETPSDEEEPLQAKPFISSIQRQEMPEEEKDKLQTKSVSDAIQRQETPGDEDEPLQAKPLISTIQRQEMPEEEKDKLQTKSMSGVIQRQETPIDEEEPVQAKSLISAIQRQEAVQEDDEPLQAKPQIQRRSDGSTAATPQLERAIEQSRGSGHALPHSTRNSMEQAFGADFSGVRIHTDSRADQLNQSIQARAFTTSQDIYFRQGEHNPGTRAGQELLAHELTHVVQQNSKLQPKLVQRDPAVEPTVANPADVVLTPVQMQRAIRLNSVMFTDPAELAIIRDVLGIAKEPSVVDNDFVNAVVRFQSSFGLQADGMLGAATSARLSQEITTEANSLGDPPTGTPLRRMARRLHLRSMTSRRRGLITHQGFVGPDDNPEGAVTVRVGDRQGGSTNAISLEYTGENSNNVDWLQFINMQMFATPSGAAAPVFNTGAVATTGGNVNWSTAAATNWFVDAVPSGSPLYNVSGGLNTRAAGRRLAMFDEPGGASGFPVAQAFTSPGTAAAGATTVTLRMRFDSYVIRNNRARYHVSWTATTTYNITAGTSSNIVYAQGAAGLVNRLRNVHRTALLAEYPGNLIR